MVGRQPAGSAHVRLPVCVWACARGGCAVSFCEEVCGSYVYIVLNGKMSAAEGGRRDRVDAEDEDVVPGPGPSKKKRLVSYNKK